MVNKQEKEMDIFMQNIFSFLHNFLLTKLAEVKDNLTY